MSMIMKIHFILMATAFSWASVLIAADVPDVFGKPKNVGVDGGLGVYLIWYENGVWHLRTSTEDSEGKRTKNKVSFTGSVVCDGKLSVEGVDLEKKADFITPHKDGNRFDFQFSTHAATDQADFKVASTAQKLKFKLTIAGQDAPPQRIFIGKNGSSPVKHEFELPANPKVVVAVGKPPAMPKVAEAPKIPAAAKVPTVPGQKVKGPEDE